MTTLRNIFIYFVIFLSSFSLRANDGCLAEERKNKVALCEMTKKILNCDDLAKQSPEVKEKIKDCHQQDLFSSSMISSLGCFFGARNAMKDLVDIFPTTLSFFRTSREQAEFRQRLEKINAQPTQKLLMARMTSKYFNHSESELRLVDTQMIYLAMREEQLQLLAINPLGLKARVFLDELANSHEEYNKKVWINLWNKTKVWMLENTKGLACFNDVEVSKKICYATLDLWIGGKGITRIEKLADKSVQIAKSRNVVLPTKTDIVYGSQIGKGGNAAAFNIANYPDLVAVKRGNSKSKFNSDLKDGIELIESQKKLDKQVQLARVLKVWQEESGTVVYLQERAKGNILHRRNSSTSPEAWGARLSELAEAPQEFYNKFILDLAALEEAGIRVDPSKPSNFFFDDQVGFTIIDVKRKEGVVSNIDTIEVPLINTSYLFSQESISKKVADSINTILNKLKQAGAPIRRADEIRNGVNTRIKD